MGFYSTAGSFSYTVERVSYKIRGNRNQVKPDVGTQREGIVKSTFSIQETPSALWGQEGHDLG